MNNLRWKVASIGIDDWSYEFPEITVELNAVLNPNIDGYFFNTDDIAKELESKLNRSGDKMYIPMARHNEKTEYQKAFYRNIVNGMYGSNPYYRPEIKDVIFNDPATIVFWTDGTKTVVKCQDGDVFDPEKGLTMAIAKKVYGNKGSYCNAIKKWCDPYYEKHGGDREVIAGDMYDALIDAAMKIFGEKPKDAGQDIDGERM